jgi:hypothetical protein
MVVMAPAGIVHTPSPGAHTAQPDAPAVWSVQLALAVASGWHWTDVATEQVPAHA